MSEARLPDYPDPDLSPAAGWGPVPAAGVFRARRNFVSGDPEGDRIRIRFYQREADGHFVGKVWFGPQAEGPPLCAHGGSIAAVLDDAMGRACWVAGHMVLAGRIGIEFLKKVPLGRTLVVEAWVAEVDGRKVHARGRVLEGEGPGAAELARSDGTFIEITREYFEAERRRLEGLGYRFDGEAEDDGPGEG